MTGGGSQGDARLGEQNGEARSSVFALAGTARPTLLLPTHDPDAAGRLARGEAAKAATA